MRNANNMLNEKFSFEKCLKWNDIVPMNLHCCLPNINYLKTNIEGYISINENFKENMINLGEEALKNVIDTKPRLRASTLNENFVVECARKGENYFSNNHGSRLSFLF